MNKNNNRADEICEQCDHLFEPHILHKEDQNDYGFVTCPVEGCECYSTWSYDDSPLPEGLKEKNHLNVIGNKKKVFDTFIDPNDPNREHP